MRLLRSLLPVSLLCAGPALAGTKDDVPAFLQKNVVSRPLCASSEYVDMTSHGLRLIKVKRWETYGGFEAFTRDTYSYDFRSVYDIEWYDKDEQGEWTKLDLRSYRDLMRKVEVKYDDTVDRYIGFSRYTSVLTDPPTGFTGRGTGWVEELWTDGDELVQRTRAISPVGYPDYPFFAQIDQVRFRLDGDALQRSDLMEIHELDRATLNWGELLAHREPTKVRADQCKGLDLPRDGSSR